MTTPAPPRRRWFSFSLRTLFVLVTLACVAVWLGPDLWLVYQRRAMRKWITDRGGKVTLLSWYRYPRERFPAVSISEIRRWMGDEAVTEIALPRGAAETDFERAKAIFREADSIKYEPRSTMGGRGGGFF